MLNAILEQTRDFSLDPDRAPQWVDSLLVRRHALLHVCATPGEDHGGRCATRGRGDRRVIGIGRASLLALLDIADALALVNQLGDIEAVEIIASINGMETIWLLVPSIPLTEVFKQ